MKTRTVPVFEVIRRANIKLTNDVKYYLKKALRLERSTRGKLFLKLLSENIKTAREKGFPLCQDTGIVSFYVPSGMDEKYIKKETKKAYKLLRDSQAADPFRRRPDKRNLPAINRSGGRGKGAFIIRGGGSMNSTGLFMAGPSSKEEEIICLVSDFVIKKAPFSCPPVFVGVGIGSTPAGAVAASEEVLLGDLRKPQTKMERKILDKINASGIGPGGWGGKNTALCVKIRKMPCHIATLPVAVTVSCWCLRKGKISGR